METWRNFQKTNESMEKVQALGTKYSDIDDNRLHALASIAHSIAIPDNPEKSSDATEALKMLDDREREYVEALLAINREVFGDKMGHPWSPSGPPLQDEEEF